MPCTTLMNIKIYDDKFSLGRAAAEQAAEAIRRAIQEKGQARIIAATGASQFELLDSLTRLPGIAWKRVELFHLDEYIGLPANHPASFRNYLLTRLINKVGITQSHLLDGELDPAEVIRSVGSALQSAPIDVALVGIGENGHLAFNDPPADFDTDEPYLVVTLDDDCRRQQLGEGNHRCRPGCAKGESGRRMLRRRHQSAGACLDSSHASERLGLSGHELR